MIKFIFVLNSDGNLVYGMTPESVYDYIEKKTENGKSIFAPETPYYPTSNGTAVTAELDEAEEYIRACAKEGKTLWVLGNKDLFKRTIDAADELYITQLDKFCFAEEEFIPFGNEFTLYKKGKLHLDKGVAYQHQIWLNNKLLSAGKLDKI